ncbi:MAG: shikimate kinase [Mycobacteriales bacterium]
MSGREPGPALVVVGPPGAGKTTIGRLVAAALGVGFRDTDDDIESAQGKPIADIFIDEGEEHFRVLERDAVRAALQSHEGVLALGGGAPVQPDIAELLCRHRVAYLQVGLADAAERVGFNRDRPLLLGNPRAQLRALLAERAPRYAAVASFVIDTHGREPAEIAAEVTAHIAAEEIGATEEVGP